MTLAYSNGWKYQTEEDYVVQTPLLRMPFDIKWCAMDRFGVLSLKEGYAWDGATGWPDFPSIIRPSAIHDALCQAIRLELIPHSMYREVNQFFYQECLRSGMWKAHAAAVLAGVNLAKSGDPKRGPSDHPTLFAK